MLAVGLETGEIYIHCNLIDFPEKWEITCLIPVGYDWFILFFTWDSAFPHSIAHVDQVHRLAWRSTDEPTEKRLASCSEDGTVKILVVQVRDDV